MSIKQYRNVIVRSSTVGDDSVLGDDVFITDSRIGRHCTIERRGMIFGSVLGDYSYTGYNTVVKSAEIGKFCSISWNISIGGGAHDFHAVTTHPFPYAVKWGMYVTPEKTSYFDEPLRIGSDVWIGSNACILRGLTVGDGAVIGAGSVVTRDVPPYAVVVGNPARVLKYRFSEEIIARLLRLKWWNMPDEVLRQHVSVFRGDFTEQLSSLEELEELVN